MYINWWEEFQVEKGYEVYNVKTKEVYPHQETLVDNKSRREVRVNIELQPYEYVILGIRTKKERPRHIPLDPLFVRDERYDYVSPYLDNEVNATQFYIESPFIRISWKRNQGITEFYDKVSQESIIMENREHNPLTPVYNYSEIEYKYKFDPEEITSVRKDYGRNRSVISSEEFAGNLINVKTLANGPLFARVQLKYELKGTLYSVIEITVYRDKPQVDFSYILGKDTVWEPEALYLSLPFTYNKDQTLWLDKSGANIRPRVDQLPYTMNKFYTMQNGYCLVSNNGSLIISSPDVPLLRLGSLQPSVMTKESMEEKQNIDIQYSWLMNNYWETNFATSLGGFYRFDYHMYLSQDIKDVTTAQNKAKELSHNFIITQVTYE